MALLIHQFPCLSDNYGVLLHDDSSGATASIDAPDAAAVLAALAEKGWALTDILVTHKHADHIQGIPGVRARHPQARIVAPRAEAEQIGTVDLAVGEGDDVHIGNHAARIIETPGHTRGHIVYHFANDGLLFAGDTLFVMGCGRVFETPLPVMWDSLQKLARLPPETRIYCGHEYTLANARFALTIDPANAALQARAKAVEHMRAEGQPTLPTTLREELATNPFLRAGDSAIKAHLNMEGRSDADVFGEIRERKNRS